MSRFGLSTILLSLVLFSLTLAQEVETTPNACSGRLVSLRLENPTKYKYILYTVKDTATENAVYEYSSYTNAKDLEVYEFCATSQYYTVDVAHNGTNMNYWNQNIYLFVSLKLADNEYETIGRLSFNTRFANFVNSYTFTTQYALPAGSSWYYKYGESSDDTLFNEDHSTWSTATSGNFPTTTNAVQVYKTSVTIPENGLNDISAFVLSLKYDIACIVSINGVEAFRNGVIGDLPGIETNFTAIYESNLFRQVSLPLYLNDGVSTTPLFNEGVNTISVVLVADDEFEVSETTPIFDFALRFISNQETASRVFDFTAALSENIINEESTADHINVFDLYPFSSISSQDCENNYVDITFNNDRRECISSINVIGINNNAKSKFPKSFTLKAKNPEDEEWTTLKQASDLYCETNADSFIVKVVNNNAYNMYRIENMSGNDCAWSIAEIMMHLPAYTSIPALSYPAANFVTSVTNDLIYPENEHFTDFTIAPELPEDFTFNHETGALNCSMTMDFTGTFTITAKNLYGAEVSATIPITVAPCGEGYDVISFYLKLSNTYAWIWNNGNRHAMELYAGKEATGPIVKSIIYNGFKDKTVKYCLPNGIYTIKAYDNTPNGDGWWMGEHYRVTADNDFTFFSGGVRWRADYETAVISATLPFKSSSEWQLYKDTVAVAENWNAVDFDASSWTASTASEFGSASATTVYVRKEFAIPSIIDYHVLNVQVKYTGGIVAYFNGQKVARFNLADSYDASTIATEAKNSLVTSTFAVILSAYNPSETKNVIAFEIHSGSADSHAIAFSATGVYGVAECSVLTYSVPGITRTNMESYYGSNTLFDWSYYPYYEFDFSKASNAGADAYAEWSVDNLEGAQFNAFGFIQSQNTSPNGCEFSIEGYDDENREFVPFGSFADESYTRAKHYTYLLSNTILNERDFKLAQHRACNSYKIQFGEVFLEYCAIPNCSADGDYPDTMNGHNAYVSCEPGFSGHKYRACVNGVFGEVVDECVYDNPITYNDINFLSVSFGEYIQLSPSSAAPIDSFTCTNLPAGLTCTTSGVIMGKIAEQATDGAHDYSINVVGISEFGVSEVTVKIAVIAEDVYSVTSSATVTDIEGNPVTPFLEGGEYSFYYLDAYSEYIIADPIQASVIDPSGKVWKYEMPKGYNKNSFIVDGSKLFTHYRNKITSCPEGTQLIYTYEVRTNLNAQMFCAPENTKQYITTNFDSLVMTASGEALTTKRTGILPQYTIPGPIQENPESEKVISNPKNEGICSIGNYYKWSAADYSEKMLMKIKTVASTSPDFHFKPALTFQDTRKKSLIRSDKKEYLRVLKPLRDDETINNYSAEAAIELMEIFHFLRNNKPLALSRGQFKHMLEEQCTDACNNYETIIGMLRNHGLCAEDEDEATCTPFKMEDVIRPSTTERTTKWIKDQIDAGRPVFVLVSLDADQLQHHTSFNHRPINKNSPGNVNFGGVVTGYNAENEDDAYWEVMVRRHGDLNKLVKIKMDVSGKNFGNISNYAFTLNI